MTDTVAVFENYDRLSTGVARVFARQLLKTPDTTLGFATGRTPKGFYERLTELHERGLIDFQQVTAFNLDEFYPIEPDHPKRFERYMNQHLYNHVNVDRRNVHIPDGTTDQLEKEARAYEQKIRRSGGIDLSASSVSSGMPRPAGGVTDR